MNDDASKLSDVLLLLVGGNPLPNAVATLWSATPPGGSEPGTTVILVYSAESEEVCRRLESWIRSRGFPTARCSVPEARPETITHRVREALARCDGSARVNLNYTGGTKAMAVHAYRAVDQWGDDTHGRPVFSYLDARTLKMVYAPEARREYVGPNVELSLDDLLVLHGWKLLYPPPQGALLPRTAERLAAVYANGDAAIWRGWLHPNGLQGEDPTNEWLEAARLRVPCEPPLQEVSEALRAELGLPDEDFPLSNPLFAGEAENQAKRATQDGKATATSARVFRRWLGSEWLEHHTMDRLLDLKARGVLHHCYRDVQTEKPMFQIDAVAMRGYQLFVFSCSTASSPSELKKKLFEVYVRARQLGGTEAGVALVTGSEAPEVVQEEIRRELDDRNVQVFGRRHLADLGEAMGNWIENIGRED